MGPSSWASRQLCVTATTLKEQNGGACIPCQMTGAERTFLDEGLRICISTSSQVGLMTLESEDEGQARPLWVLGFTSLDEVKVYFYES